MKLRAKFTAILEGNPIKGSITIEWDGTWDEAIKQAESILRKTMTKVHVSEIGVVNRK